MNRNWVRVTLMMLGIAGVSSAQAAVDSYRYAHVTISTPWYIFMFLMIGVFAPFILMAILAWRHAMSRSDTETTNSSQNIAEK